MEPRLRRDAIVALVNQETRAVEDLAARLVVSRETVRRDLALLDAAGRLRKVHGGARAVGAEAAESPFAQRMAQAVEAKRRIAAAVARLIPPGASLFIDTGSTTLAVAEALAGVSHLTVMTNGAQIAARVAANRNHRVFLIGGAYEAEVGENLGPLAQEQIGKFRAQHVILTVGAIDGSAVMDFDLAEAEVARAMIAQAEVVTVVADHGKFARRAVFEVAPLGRIDRLVTDRAPPEPLAAALAGAGVEVILA